MPQVRASSTRNPTQSHWLPLNLDAGTRSPMIRCDLWYSVDGIQWMMFGGWYSVAGVQWMPAQRYSVDTIQWMPFTLCAPPVVSLYENHDLCVLGACALPLFLCISLSLMVSGIHRHPLVSTSSFLSYPRLSPAIIVALCESQNHQIVQREQTVSRSGLKRSFLN